MVASPPPSNSDGGMEDRSSLRTAARVLHVADLGCGGFPSPFNSGGDVEAGSCGMEAESGLPTAAFLPLHLYMNSGGGVGLPVVALLLPAVALQRRHQLRGGRSSELRWRRRVDGLSGPVDKLAGLVHGLS